MKKDEIYFREIKRSDYGALEKLIRDTWNYEKFCSPKTARVISRIYLSACLAGQTFTCVAVSSGEPVGVIMGKNERTHRMKMGYIMRGLGSAFAVLVSKEGRKIAKMYSGFNDINKAMLADSKWSWGGELAFFAVRADQRGTGVGKELYSKLLDYMHSQNITDFYLFTDSTCNYGFYEHQGMTRIGEKKCVQPMYQASELSFFIYGYGM